MRPWRIEPSLVAATLLMACGVAPDPGESTGGTSSTTTGQSTTTTSITTTEDDATSSPGATSTSASEATETSASESTSTTSGGPVGPEICRTAVTEADCEAAANECQWRPAFRVVDAESCTLEPAPDLQCWAHESSNCFEGTPLACNGDVHPRYREVDGEIQLLDYPCQTGPADVESDQPRWEICGSEEFNPQPAICYCLCGGVPPHGTSET